MPACYQPALTGTNCRRRVCGNPLMQIHDPGVVNGDDPHMVTVHLILAHELLNYLWGDGDQVRAGCPSTAGGALFSVERFMLMTLAYTRACHQCMPGVSQN